jgi:EAL domain-containing protein (putative c-di-GMP-specific phosphodiesterase class I)
MGLISRALLTRPMLFSLGAWALLAAALVLRFALPDATGIMFLAIVAIALLGTMHGMRVGLAAGVIASAAFLVWAATQDSLGPDDYLDRPGAFLTLGLIAGFYAHGALGDFDPRRAVRRHELRRALREGEIQMHYQPVANAQSGEIIGVEALARWEHPRRGLLLPDQFVPLAEGDPETIRELTRHTVERALRECGRWLEAGINLNVSVNLSAVSLVEPGFRSELAEALGRHGLSSEHLGVEITETALMADPERAAAAVEALRAMRILVIAIDDFGTGYSSLARLDQLPVDALKIDQALTARATEQDGDILRTVIELAHALGLQAVVEGVEDRATWERVAELGCDAIQGYWLSRPLPPDELTDWLAGYEAGTAAD